MNYPDLIWRLIEMIVHDKKDNNSNAKEHNETNQLEREYSTTTKLYSFSCKIGEVFILQKSLENIHII